MAATQTQPQLPPSAQVLQMSFSYVVSTCVHQAAKLGIADLLKDGPRSAAELAEATGTNTDALYRMLRALTSAGVFVESEGAMFALTPLAQTLRSDVPDSVRAMAIFVGNHMHAAVYDEMGYSLKTGKPSFTHVFGKPPFEYLPEHPEEAKEFDAAMTSHSAAGIAAIIDAYDFDQFQSIVDVGGGQGHLLAGILGRYQRPRGILFDLPYAIQNAREKGLLSADRTELIAGSFFEQIPPADAYIIKHVIHDWTDDETHKILATCRRAAPGQAKLLIAEMILPPMNEPGFAKLLDIEMLLIPGGRERTVKEYESLLAGAGFELTRVVATASPVSLIEAVPV